MWCNLGTSHAGATVEAWTEKGGMTSMHWAAGQGSAEAQYSMKGGIVINAGRLNGPTNGPLRPPLPLHGYDLRNSSPAKGHVIKI